MSQESESESMESLSCSESVGKPERMNWATKESDNSACNYLDRLMSYIFFKGRNDSEEAKDESNNMLDRTICNLQQRVSAREHCGLGGKKKRKRSGSCTNSTCPALKKKKKASKPACPCPKKKKKKKRRKRKGKGGACKCKKKK